MKHGTHGTACMIVSDQRLIRIEGQWAEDSLQPFTLTWLVQRDHGHRVVGVAHRQQ
jgi:hypothetical protein